MGLSPEARGETVFATHSWLFQFSVMQFGLCKTSAMFERLMSQVIRGLQWKHCLAYIDDMLVFGKDFDKASANCLTHTYHIWVTLLVVIVCPVLR
jgi:hypothetical protein